MIIHEKDNFYMLYCVKSKNKEKLGNGSQAEGLYE